MYFQDKDLEAVRRKLELIESSPSTSAESWREESQMDEREELSDEKEEGEDKCETDISGDTIALKPGQPA